MNKLIAMAFSCVLASACPAAVGAATQKEKRLEQCRKIDYQLRKLETLRRHGGTARKMDRWLRRMHTKQDEYSKLYCRRHRYTLAKDRDAGNRGH